MDNAVRLERATAEFGGMAELLDLIRRSFSYMDGIIDPPSSYHRLTLGGLRAKCASEIAIVAIVGGKLAGCAFLAERADHFYLGKLAVRPDHQGRGIGRRLVREVEAIARDAGKPMLELQTRVELSANHAAFARLGFTEVARSSHEGYSQATSITMRKPLS